MSSTTFLPLTKGNILNLKPIMKAEGRIRNHRGEPMADAIIKTLYLQLQSWLAMLPMMMSEGLYSDMKLSGRIHTMTAFNAINLAPLQGEWKGTKTPSSIFPGRRGQITTWNAFDNVEGNYNIVPATTQSCIQVQNILHSLDLWLRRLWMSGQRSAQKNPTHRVLCQTGTTGHHFLCRRSV